MKRGRKFLYNWELEEVDDDKEELQGDVVCVCVFSIFKKSSSAIIKKLRNFLKGC